MSGFVMLGTAIAIVELWRRGYLNRLIASITDTAKAGASVRSRPFRLPTAPDTFLGPYGEAVTP